MARAFDLNYSAPRLRAQLRAEQLDRDEFYREQRMATALSVLRDRQPGVSIAATWAAYRPLPEKGDLR